MPAKTHDFTEHETNCLDAAIRINRCAQGPAPPDPLRTALSHARDDETFARLFER